MKALRTVFALTALAAMAAFIAVGCSSDDNSGTSGKSLTDQVIDDFVESTYVDASSDSVTAEFAGDVISDEVFEATGPQFNDVIKVGDIVYAATDDGIVTHNMADGANNLIPTEDPVFALVDLGDKIIAGGKQLFILDNGQLCNDEYMLSLPGPITTLHPYGTSLLIGTTDGLFTFDFDGVRELVGGIEVSQISSDPDGVWIGTFGQGLYRWDGENFRKRYLSRDSSLFDYVTAMHYNHSHLYLGTTEGLFIYDGGRWQPYGTADGLPSAEITAIDASDWVIKIGTARGAVTFFEGEFKPMAKMETKVVTEFIKDGSKLLAATTNAGLIMKSGGLVTTLYDSDSKPAQIAFEEDL